MKYHERVGTEMRNFTKSKGGFTIIEVVLVLAIAGLIFLIVFLAVPALQRSQRDTQRKSDLGRFMSQISSFQSNARGNVPAATAAAIETAPGGLVPKYLTANGDSFEDPKGGAYTFVYGTGAAPTADGEIRYAVNARCSTTNPGDVSAGSGARQVAASIKLEGGGAYCQQN